MIPGFLRAVGIAKQIKVSGVDHAVLRQRFKIDHAFPVRAVKQHDWHPRRLAGLSQRQNLEQFVERAKAAGKHHKRFGAHRQMHFAHREIMEAERQLRRRPRIGKLFVRQRDVEADARRPGVARAAIGRLHRARSAPRGDDVIARRARMPVQRAAAERADAPKFACLLIPISLTVGAVLVNARAAKHHNG